MYPAMGFSESDVVRGILQLSTEERKGYERYLGSLRDEKSMIRTHYEEGKEEGLAEGRVEGREEGRAETLKQMIKEMAKAQMSIDAIATIAGMSSQEVAELLGPKL